jgi:hypothetical protein
MKCRWNCGYQAGPVFAPHQADESTLIVLTRSVSHQIVSGTQILKGVTRRCAAVLRAAPAGAVVRRGDHNGRPCLVEFDEQAKQSLRETRIDICSWLVGQYEPWSTYDGPGYRHALLLSTG